MRCCGADHRDRCSSLCATRCHRRPDCGGGCPARANRRRDRPRDSNGFSGRHGRNGCQLPGQMWRRLCPSPAVPVHLRMRQVQELLRRFCLGLPQWAQLRQPLRAAVQSHRRVPMWLGMRQGRPVLRRLAASLPFHRSAGLRLCIRHCTRRCLQSAWRLAARQVGAGRRHLSICKNSMPPGSTSQSAFCWSTPLKPPSQKSLPSVVQTMLKLLLNQLFWHRRPRYACWLSQAARTRMCTVGCCVTSISRIPNRKTRFRSTCACCAWATGASYIRLQRAIRTRPWR